MITMRSVGGGIIIVIIVIPHHHTVVGIAAACGFCQQAPRQLPKAATFAKAPSILSCSSLFHASKPDGSLG